MLGDSIGGGCGAENAVAGRHTGVLWTAFDIEFASRVLHATLQNIMDKILKLTKLSEDKRDKKDLISNLLISNRSTNKLDIVSQRSWLVVVLPHTD